MCAACLRLRTEEVVRCSCRTTFGGDGDILARVFPCRVSSMGPMSSIPHGGSLLYDDCSLWFELSAAGDEGVAGYLAEDSPPNAFEYGGMVSEGVE